MSPCAVEAASDALGDEAELEPQEALAETVGVVEGAVVEAALVELEELPLEPQPASATVTASTAAAKRTDRRWWARISRLSMLRGCSERPENLLTAFFRRRSGPGSGQCLW
jgi:hypothetical protein